MKSVTFNGGVMKRDNCDDNARYVLLSDGKCLEVRPAACFRVLVGCMYVCMCVCMYLFIYSHLFVVYINIPSVVSTASNDRFKGG